MIETIQPNSWHEDMRSRCYRSCRWRSVRTHVVWDGTLHCCCHGNPLARHWPTSIHRPRVPAWRRKQIPPHCRLNSFLLLLRMRTSLMEISASTAQLDVQLLHGYRMTVFISAFYFHQHPHFGCVVGLKWHIFKSIRLTKCLNKNSLIFTIFTWYLTHWTKPVFAT